MSEYLAEWYPFAWWYGTHCVLDPSDGVFGRFDLAALCGCHTLNVCYVMLNRAAPAPYHSKLLVCVVRNRSTGIQDDESGD